MQSGQVKGGTMATETPEKLLLSDKEAAELLGIGRTLFWGLHSSGRLPLPVRLGRRTLWRRDLLEKFVEWNCPAREKFLVMLEQEKQK